MQRARNGPIAAAPSRPQPQIEQGGGEEEGETEQPQAEHTEAQAAQRPDRQPRRR